MQTLAYILKLNGLRRHHSVMPDSALMSGASSSSAASVLTAFLSGR
jgi:hypothetical protein